jgi:RNA polymerase primary sigma factor
MLDRPTRLDSSQPVSIEEERALARRIRHGDQQAVERLVLANLGLVGSIARTFQGFGLSFEDLMQEGTQGLLRAAADFDPEAHGVRFATYAGYAIRNAIQQALKIGGSLIRLPDYMVRLRAKYRRAVGNLIAEEVASAGREDPGAAAPGRGTDHEIAARLGISLETLDRVRQSDVARVAFHRDSDEGDSSPLEEMIADDSQPLFDLDSIEELDCLREAIERLAPHEAWIIRHRFGLDETPDGRPRTIRSIARAHRLAPETVKRFEETAMTKLRAHMRKRFGDDE